MQHFFKQFLELPLFLNYWNPAWSVVLSLTGNPFSIIRRGSPIGVEDDNAYDGRIFVDERCSLISYTPGCDFQ